jgi:transposase
VFVGIDWASRAHELCIVEATGAVVEQFGFAHSERGIRGALERLAKLGDPVELPIAIERPDGLLVDRLLEAGHHVVPIHANAFHAARPRWEGAGSKSDVGDAFRLADLLRTDHHRLRPLRPLDQATRELQALVRLRDDHVAARVAATNQLAALLGQHWPGAGAIFGRLDSDVVSELVQAQAQLVRTLLATIADLDRAIAATLDQHAKAQLLKPLPRVGTISLGQLVAEVGPLLERTTSADEAAALCGAVPVTKRSGQQHAVTFRYATNAKARKAITLDADNSRRGSPWAERIYRDARARGCRHAHAIRILARAWLRVIWACWHTDTTYNPARRRGHDRHLQPLTLT